MEFQSGEWIDVYRELLPHDDWQELVRIQVTQHSETRAGNRSCY